MARSGRVVFYNIRVHHQCIKKSVCCLWPTGSTGYRQWASVHFHCAVEQFVQTFKQALKAGERSGVSVQHRLQSFLLSYRSTPQTTTGHYPAKLFVKRTLRTRFDLWSTTSNPNEGHDAHARDHEFEVGTRILAKDVRNSS